jgi:lipoprotein signal peptidase
VSRPVTAFALTAAVAATVDLSHKAASDATFFNRASTGYVVYVLAFALAWVAAILATRSLSIAAAGGVLAGGVAGNLLSLALWPGVPDPIELEEVAFNLADVFVLAGFFLTAVATLAFAVRNRDRLREPLRLR